MIKVTSIKQNITIEHTSVKTVDAVTVHIACICTSSESALYLYQICENIFESFKAIERTPFLDFSYKKAYVGVISIKGHNSYQKGR